MPSQDTKLMGRSNVGGVLWCPLLPSLALPTGSWIIHWGNESSKGIRPWTLAVNVGLHNPSNNPGTNLIRKKSPSNTKTKNSQLYKHWECNSWSAEIKGAWENTSPSPAFSSPVEVPAASQGSLLQPCADDLVPAKIGTLWSQQGDALGLQLVDINSTGSAGVEEISQLGQVTRIPCSESEQKELHFPASAPAGYFSRVNSDHFLTGCSRSLVLTPQLFSRERCFSRALCSCSWNLLQDRVNPGLSPSQCVSHSHQLAHTSSVHVCVGERVERARDRQTSPEVFTERERQQYGEGGC